MDHSITHEELVAKFLKQPFEPINDYIKRYPKFLGVSSYRDIGFFNHFVLRVYRNDDCDAHQVRLYYVSYEQPIQNWIATTKLECDFYNKPEVLRLLKRMHFAKQFKVGPLTARERVWK